MVVGGGACKAAAAAESARAIMARGDWEDAYFEIHALLYDTISALSLLAVAEGIIAAQTAGMGGDSLN